MAVCSKGSRRLRFPSTPHPQGILNKTAQWWVPLSEGTKQRFDYWAVVARPPSNTSTYEYNPEEISLAEGWWTVEVRLTGV
jgi:hypothetical protein